MKKNIMKRAWEIRKAAAQKFCCKVSEIIFSDCLRQSWTEEREMRELISMSSEELERLQGLIAAELASRTPAAAVAAEPAAEVAEPAAVAPTHTLEISGGCIDQADVVFEDHVRGKNWIATVQFDPKSPGGLDRSFWKKASGSFKEVPGDLTAGQTLEIAADYISGGGKKHPKRRFFEIIAVNATGISLLACEQPTR